MERKTELDSLKGLLIICVVMGHIAEILPFKELKILMRFIYTFHVPVFFIISGMLFNKEKWIDNYKEFIYRKIFTLIIPYMFFEIVAVFTHVYIIKDTVLNIKGAIFQELLLYESVGATWFLTALFFSQLLVLPIIKFFNNKYIYIITALCFFISQFLNKNHMLIIVGRTFIALGFILLGFLLKKSLSNSDILRGIIGLVIVLAVTLFNGYVDPYSMTIRSCILYAIGGVAGAFFCLGFSKYYNMPFLCWIGENTIVILGTHQIVMKLIFKYTHF